MKEETAKMFVVSMVMVSGGETLAKRTLGQFFNFSEAFKHADDAQKIISSNEDAHFFKVELSAFEIEEFKNNDVQGMLDALNK
jgi:hypothetical protein